jgi:Domain of unknown function (DUF397)
MRRFGVWQAQQPAWRRATWCQSGECVEVAQQNGVIVIRDSKRPSRRPLRYTAEEWNSFIRGVKAGEFDDLA